MSFRYRQMTRHFYRSKMSIKWYDNQVLLKQTAVAAMATSEREGERRLREGGGSKEDENFFISTIFIFAFFFLFPLLFLVRLLTTVIGFPFASPTKIYGFIYFIKNNRKLWSIHNCHTHDFVWKGNEREILSYRGKLIIVQDGM